MNTRAKHRRPSLRYSLRSLLVVVGFCSLSLGWLSNEIAGRLRLYQALRSEAWTVGYASPVNGGSLDRLVARLTDQPGTAIAISAKPATNDDDLRVLTRIATLTHVDLQGTQVTDAGLIKLAVLPNLKTVHVEKSQVTENGVLEFRRRRPRVRVVFPWPPPFDYKCDLIDEYLCEAMWRRELGSQELIYLFVQPRDDVPIGNAGTKPRFKPLGKGVSRLPQGIYLDGHRIGPSNGHRVYVYDSSRATILPLPEVVESVATLKTEQFESLVDTATWREIKARLRLMEAKGESDEANQRARSTDPA